ncbi:MAG: polysaccharide biosynthesis C-terminal domain-containing protein, partial [Fulvivirga sp.]
PVLQVMAIYGVFEPFQRQFGVTLNAIGKARINFYFIVISSTVGIIFTYIFIDQYGVMGAAYSTLITYALSAIIIQYILYKQIGVNTANIFKYGLQSVSKGVKMILNR